MTVEKTANNDIRESVTCLVYPSSTSEYTSSPDQILVQMDESRMMIGQS